MRCRGLLVLGVGLVFGACSDRSVGRSLAPDGASLAKGGGGGGAGGGVSDPTSTWLFPLADGALGLKSDGRYGDGTYSVYASATCGVGTGFFATTANSNSGDITLNLGSVKGKHPCSRALTLVFDDGYSSTSSAFVNLHQIENTTYSIAIGSTVLRGLNVLYTPRCDGLQFGHPNATASDSVFVTRIDAHTWHAYSQAYPNDRALCTTNGQAYHVQVNFVVTSDRDLP